MIVYRDDYFFPLAGSAAFALAVPRTWILVRVGVRSKGMRTYLLGSVLPLLPEFPGSLGDLLSHSLLRMLVQNVLKRKRRTYPDEPVPGLKLHLRLLIIVDQTETLSGSTSELGLQAKDNNPLLLGLVQSGELVA
jgi:hypothetical protein